MKISVTGKFGCGKSTFAKQLSHGRITVLSGDEIGKEVLNENYLDIFKFLNIKFKEDYLSEIKTAIKADEGTFVKYNNWMYTHLPEEIVNRCQMYDDVIIDAALIFEWKIDEFFDYNILISDGSFDERFERISKDRLNTDRELYLLLDKYQWQDEKKMIYADVTVENKKSINDLKKRADEIFDKIFHGN